MNLFEIRINHNQFRHIFSRVHKNPPLKSFHLNKHDDESKEIKFAFAAPFLFSPLFSFSCFVEQSATRRKSSLCVTKPISLCFDSKHEIDIFSTAIHLHSIILSECHAYPPHQSAKTYNFTFTQLPTII